MNAETRPALSRPDVNEMRDWFAGQALHALISTPRQPGVLSMTLDGLAKAAYDYAEAMLRARAART